MKNNLNLAPASAVPIHSSDLGFYNPALMRLVKTDSSRVNDNPLSCFRHIVQLLKGAGVKSQKLTRNKTRKVFTYKQRWPKTVSPTGVPAT